MNAYTRAALTAVAATLMTAAAAAQVTLRKQPVVFLGCAAVTTAPATLDADKVRAATPEWQLIERLGIDRTSARGRQLVSRMGRRVRAAVREVAVRQGRDFVTRTRDLKQARGRSVADLTAQVVAELES